MIHNSMKILTTEGFKSIGNTGYELIDKKGNIVNKYELKKSKSKTYILNISDGSIIKCSIDQEIPLRRNTIGKISIVNIKQILTDEKYFNKFGLERFVNFRIKDNIDKRRYQHIGENIANGKISFLPYELTNISNKMNIIKGWVNGIRNESSRFYIKDNWNIIETFSNSAFDILKDIIRECEGLCFEEQLVLDGIFKYRLKFNMSSRQALYDLLCRFDKNRLDRSINSIYVIDEPEDHYDIYTEELICLILDNYSYIWSKPWQKL